MFLLCQTSSSVPLLTTILQNDFLLALHGMNIEWICLGPSFLGAQVSCPIVGAEMRKMIHIQTLLTNLSCHFMHMSHSNCMLCVGIASHSNLTDKLVIAPHLHISFQSRVVCGFVFL